MLWSQPDTLPQLRAVAHPSVGNLGFHSANVADVFERVAVDYDQVCELPGFEGADSLFPPSSLVRVRQWLPR